jgi:hypothetical protein
MAVLVLRSLGDGLCTGQIHNELPMIFSNTETLKKIRII